MTGRLGTILRLNPMSAIIDGYRDVMFGTGPADWASLLGAGLLSVVLLLGWAGVQWRDLWKKWDFGVDYRIGDHMARNKTSSEAVITWPNSFYTIQGVSTYISRRF